MAAFGVGPARVNCRPTRYLISKNKNQDGEKKNSIPLLTQRY
jgi:hypothetical protein